MKPDLKKPYVWLATWFGFGLLKPAPGTWGSLGALPFAIAIYVGGGIYALVAGIIAVSIIGYWATARYETATNTHDSKEIVIDEVAGQWIALLPGLYVFGISPLYLFLAFVFFRFFDILKPWPVSYFDKKVVGALGVMGDDIIAGIYAGLCISGLIYAGLG